MLLVYSNSWRFELLFGRRNICTNCTERNLYNFKLRFFFEIFYFWKMPHRCFPRSCSSALSEYLTSSIWIWQFKTQHVRSAQCEKCLESLSTGVKSGAILAWRESGSDPNNLERKANSALLDKLTGKGRIKAGSNSGPWAPIVPFHVNRLRFSSRLDAYLFTGRFPCWFQ